MRVHFGRGALERLPDHLRRSERYAEQGLGTIPQALFERRAAEERDRNNADQCGQEGRNDDVRLVCSENQGGESCQADPNQPGVAAVAET